MMVEAAAAARFAADSVQNKTIDRGLRQILCEVLMIDASTVDQLTMDSGLFGSLPEIDSMAVANLITAIEDRFEFTIDDEDVDSEMLETFGGLTAFVKRKLDQA